MTTTCELKSRGQTLDLSSSAFGELNRSDDVLGNAPALRQRLDRDGYLYVPGFFHRDDVMEVRSSLTSRLAEQGLLNPDFPHIEGVWNPDQRTGFKPDIARNNEKLEALIYGPELMGFYETFFGEAVLHFDFTWLRAVGPGQGTHPHCDLVYMGRGTHDLLTCWIPYGDVPLELGGLIVLEGSHLQSERIRGYLNVDVDSYCENRPEQLERVRISRQSIHPGWLSQNPVTLREKLGGRWLTTEWQAGEFITFKMNLVHASLDNATERIRLSSDSRYQRASEPADERWVGPDPVGHSLAGKRGRIC